MEELPEEKFAGDTNCQNFPSNFKRILRTTNFILFYFFVGFLSVFPVRMNFGSVDHAAVRAMLRRLWA